MQDTTVARLYDDPLDRFREAARADGTGKTCPTHKVRLDGGPVQYHCPTGHRVMAADIDPEYAQGPT